MAMELRFNDVTGDYDPDKYNLIYDPTTGEFRQVPKGTMSHSEDFVTEMTPVGETTADFIQWYLFDHPCSKAKDIADHLNISRYEVNKILYGELRNKVKQDTSYRWSLR